MYLGGIFYVRTGMHREIIANLNASVFAGASVHTNLIILLGGVLAGESHADSHSSLFACQFDGVSSENIELVHL